MSNLITKLVPILHVQDPDAERRFYEQLGLRTTYEGPEYPGFIAVGNDAVEFGLSRRPGAGPAASGLTWQLGVSDVNAAITACEQSGLRFEVTTERPREDWTYRIIKVQSPNGMEVLLEESGAPGLRLWLRAHQTPGEPSLSHCSAADRASGGTGHRAFRAVRTHARHGPDQLRDALTAVHLPARRQRR